MLQNSRKRSTRSYIRIRSYFRSRQEFLVLKCFAYQETRNISLLLLGQTPILQNHSILQLVLAKQKSQNISAVIYNGDMFVKDYSTYKNLLTILEDITSASPFLAMPIGSSLQWLDLFNATFLVPEVKQPFRYFIDIGYVHIMFANIQDDVSNNKTIQLQSLKGNQNKLRIRRNYQWGVAVVYNSLNSSYKKITDKQPLLSYNDFFIDQNFNFVLSAQFPVYERLVPVDMAGKPILPDDQVKTVDRYASHSPINLILGNSGKQPVSEYQIDESVTRKKYLQAGIGLIKITNLTYAEYMHVNWKGEEVDRFEILQKRENVVIMVMAGVVGLGVVVASLIIIVASCRAKKSQDYKQIE